jgi:hypothetical protein
MKYNKLIGEQQRKLSEAQKKKIAGRQKYKCANEPGKKLRYLEDYECPFWKQAGKDCGSFDESGYEIDHINEVSMGVNNYMFSFIFFLFIPLIFKSISIPWLSKFFLSWSSTSKFDKVSHMPNTLNVS